VFVEKLPITKTDALADYRKVVSDAAVAWPLATLQEEKRRRTFAKKPVPFRTVEAEAVNGACRDRNETGNGRSSHAGR
jgi:hypothetical protein